MSNVPFSVHAQQCTHIEAILRLYESHPEDTRDFVYEGVFNPVNDSAKRAVLIGEMHALYDAFGCNGVADGTCPLLEKKHESKTRKPFAKLGNSVFRVISNIRGV